MYFKTKTMHEAVAARNLETESPSEASFAVHALESNRSRGEIEPLSADNLDEVVEIRKKTFPKPIIKGNFKEHVQAALKKHDADKFSFLWRDPRSHEPLGFCLAYSDFSDIYAHHPLVVNVDTVAALPNARQNLTGAYIMREILARAAESEFKHVEFFARESTTYKGLKNPHTAELIRRLGFSVGAAGLAGSLGLPWLKTLKKEKLYYVSLDKLQPT